MGTFLWGKHKKILFEKKWGNNQMHIGRGKQIPSKAISYEYSFIIKATTPP